MFLREKNYSLSKAFTGTLMTIFMAFGGIPVSSIIQFEWPDAELDGLEKALTSSATPHQFYIQIDKKLQNTMQE